MGHVLEVGPCSTPPQAGRLGQLPVALVALANVVVLEVPAGSPPLVDDHVGGEAVVVAAAPRADLSHALLAGQQLGLALLGPVALGQAQVIALLFHLLLDPFQLGPQVGVDAVPLRSICVAVEQPLEQPRLLAVDVGDRVGRDVGKSRHANRKQQDGRK